VHEGWCFRWLAQELEDRGHEVAAHDLPCEEVGLTPLDYAPSATWSRSRRVVARSSGSKWSRSTV